MAEPTDDEPPHKTTTTTATATAAWGTLEELLLVSAVNRYGTTSWDSVARELHKRFSSSNNSSFSLFTPHVCQQKYRDLKRRFSAVAGRNSGQTAAADGNTTSVWLDELRQLRVAELRRELERYDVSIVSLQSKVNRLKEERENPDLQKTEDEAKFEPPPETVAVGGGRRNESVNESNSTDRKKEPADEPDTEPDRPETGEPGRAREPVEEDDEDSCSGSSNSKDPDRKAGGGDRVDSGELVESVSESKGSGGGGGGGEAAKEKEKESSDVQSAASLSRKEKNRREKKLTVVTVVSGNSSGDENQSPAMKSTNSGGGGKGQPLVDFFEVVRAHKLGSVFRRRLESQETPKYKSLIRQHIDLEMIQRRLEEGQYTACNTKFYRDLMLLINNAIVFFTNKSTEHKAALELRHLVTKQLESRSFSHKSQTPKPQPPPPPPKPPKSEPDLINNLKPKLAITGPVIACRKRSSIAGKPSGGAEKKESVVVVAPPAAEKAATKEKETVVKQPKEEKTSPSLSSLIKKRTRDQIIGSKSSSSKTNNNKSRPNNPNPVQKTSPSTPATAAKGENSETKADKKKPNPENTLKNMKRASGSGNGSLLDLLKNSAEKKNGGNSNSNGNKSERRKDQEPRNRLSSKPGRETVKGEGRGSPASRNTGRPPKRAAAIAAMGKRGREGGGEAEALAKKRQRK